MNRDDGLRLLGLWKGATAHDVRRAYRARCLPLKTQVLTAPRVTLKDRYRGDLRELVLARDAALGKSLRESWNGDRIGVDPDGLIEKLQELPADRLDRPGARAFLGLGGRARDDDVRHAYRLRARALIRRFANASDDYEMAEVRRARLKLRTVRNFAL